MSPSIRGKIVKFFKKDINKYCKYQLDFLV